MPMFRLTALSPKSLAICGKAVAITVASRFSMKKVIATSKAMQVAWRGVLVAARLAKVTGPFGW
ncbi:hypothetical protein PPUJ13061_16030 [Pseudomonas putida]|uniref:Uncharacterized protein n=1 Tax=Pseudomonas putida NBRC 14164 TaxID=1211579 RepID=A0ABN5UN63_PSEPU|nr:hypothetical protein PP4_32750 [Pseudomonas putida NBRC 14164]GLO01705.1 hypothetical protein PPUJ13061_16030 [Pseudomonas putida]GLO24920.1 hypothetical protein PPUJ21368_27490 [Pseudomonas putida]